MQIDCRNLACPEPVIRVKNAFESLKIGDKLEILVNEIAPKENIKRFLKDNGFECEIIENASEFCIHTAKSDELKSTDTSFAACQVKSKKVLYLNDDVAGSGDVGRSLLAKFLGATANLATPPHTIICVNNAVFMTTNRAHQSYQNLKNLESLGVKILSCGSCLEAYGLVDKLSIGQMSNAYEIMEILSSNEIINL